MPILADLDLLHSLKGKSRQISLAKKYGMDVKVLISAGQIKKIENPFYF